MTANTCESRERERESYSLENNNITIVSSLTNINSSVKNRIISKYEINKTTNETYELGFVCCFLSFLSQNIFNNITKFLINIFKENLKNTNNYLTLAKAELKNFLDINILILNKNKSKVEVEIS